MDVHTLTVSECISLLQQPELGLVLLCLGAAPSLFTSGLHNWQCTVATDTRPRSLTSKFTKRKAWIEYLAMMTLVRPAATSKDDSSLDKNVALSVIMFIWLFAHRYRAVDSSLARLPDPQLL